VSSIKLLEIIKQAAIDAVKASNPCMIVFGEVMNVFPLQILVEQKLLLDEQFLILTKAVTEHSVDISVSHYTVNDDFLDTTHSHSRTPPYAGIDSFDSHHKHKYSGRKKITIHNGLLQGEKVILIRLQEGQRYVVLDRINNHTIEGEWV
jgi:hypothetical protein